MRFEDIDIGGIYASVLSPNHRFQVIEKVTQTCCGGTQEFVYGRGFYKGGLADSFVKLAVAELMPVPSDSKSFEDALDAAEIPLEDLLRKAKHVAVALIRFDVAELLRRAEKTLKDSVSESEKSL